ncbi:unnamed protein product, partial [Chrysoparadoxa australica]
GPLSSVEEDPPHPICNSYSRGCFGLWVPATAELMSETLLTLARGRGSLSLTTDWDVGIGGGLWSTGVQLVEHFAMFPNLYLSILKGKRVLELGSGTGLVGLAATAFDPCEVAITDLASHLDIIAVNLERNKANGIIPDSCIVKVQKYDWGEALEAGEDAAYDVILGTDVAYYDCLHKPLIQTLRKCSSPHTLIILGVTRLDTGGDFFDM